VSGEGTTVDQLLARAEVDPRAGVQIADTAHLAAIAFDPTLPLLLLAATDTATGGAALPALPGRQLGRGALGVMRDLYPPVHALRRLRDGTHVALETLDEAALAADDWVVPALEPTESLASPHAIAAIAARLRAPDGCPWDRRQTHASLRTYVLEEAYEAVDAIETGAPADLAEELGDLLLQVILHAQLAAEEGAFDLTDVYRSISSKLIRRHPHVFGDVQVSGVGQVLANWERIKAEERSDAGRDGSPFAGVARALPALPASREIQERASALGWDWPTVEGVWEKVREELGELRAAADDDERVRELGDLLFVLVNLARWLGIDPEEALRSANRSFIARLEAAMALAEGRGISAGDLDPAERDRLWEEIKRR